MPDWQLFINGGLVGVLALFVWKLPEIFKIVFAYLETRQAARDREFEKLGDLFRIATKEIMDRFKEEMAEERKENLAVNRRMLDDGAIKHKEQMDAHKEMRHAVLGLANAAGLKLAAEKAAQDAVAKVRVE